MHAGICLYVFACMRVCMCACVHKVHVNNCVFLYVRLFPSICMCLHTCVSSCLFVRVDVRMCDLKKVLTIFCFVALFNSQLKLRFLQEDTGR